jgi:ABC-2 type transport system permease protein
MTAAEQTTADGPTFAPGTFTPRPRPAGTVAKITAAAAFELRIVLRNGEQLLLALVLPLAALFGGVYVTVVALPEPRINAVLPGVLALATLSTAFTSQAIVTGFDRRYGVLRRLAAAGWSRWQLLGGKTLASAAVLAGQYVILGGVALALGWRPLGSPFWVLLVTVLGLAALLGLALLVGGTLRAEATLAVANLGWLVLIALGGLIVPLSASPGWLAAVGALTPSGALCEGLRDVLQHGTAPSPMSLLVLTAWTVLGWAATVRWFRWL